MRPSHRRIQMPSLSDLQYIFVRRQLRAMIAVDIIKERLCPQLTFIVSKIFTLPSMAVLAFGLPAVRPFRFSLSGHPKGKIGHDEGKLTAGMGSTASRNQAVQLVKSLALHWCRGLTTRCKKRIRKTTIRRINMIIKIAKRNRHTRRQMTAAAHSRMSRGKGVGRPPLQYPCFCSPSS